MSHRSIYSNHRRRSSHAIPSLLGRSSFHRARHVDDRDIHPDDSSSMVSSRRSSHHHGGSSHHGRSSRHGESTCYGGFSHYSWRRFHGDMRREMFERGHPMIMGPIAEEGCFESHQSHCDGHFNTNHVHCDDSFTTIVAHSFVRIKTGLM